MSRLQLALLFVLLPAAATALVVVSTSTPTPPKIDVIVRRAPHIAMLLGADGKPMKTQQPDEDDGEEPTFDEPSGGGGSGLILGGGAGAGNAMAPKRVQIADGSSSPRGSSYQHVTSDSDGEFTLPDDLADFDPTYDPLAAERPKFDLAAASGRPDEFAWGAMAAESADGFSEWASHMKEAGVSRVVGLFSAEEASSLSSTGTPEGYFQDLEGAGFEQAGLLDPRAPGAREAVLTLLRNAQESRTKLLVHCANGYKTRPDEDGVPLNTGGHTGVVLADWLLTDYIGGDNYEEACHALSMRKRLAGVYRHPDPEVLEQWIVEGHL